MHKLWLLISLCWLSFYYKLGNTNFWEEAFLTISFLSSVSKRSTLHILLTRILAFLANKSSGKTLIRCVKHLISRHIPNNEIQIHAAIRSEWAGQRRVNVGSHFPASDTLSKLPRFDKLGLRPEQSATGKEIKLVKVLVFGVMGSGIS